MFLGQQPLSFHGAAKGNGVVHFFACTYKRIVRANQFNSSDGIKAATSFLGCVRIPA